MYRVERQKKGERDGTYSAEATASLALGEAIVADEYRKTAQSKRKAAKEAGKRDQKRYTESLDAQSQAANQLDGELTYQTEHLHSSAGQAAVAKPRKTRGNTGRKGRAHLRGIEGGRKEPEQAWRGFAMSSAAQQIDFDAPPTIY
ncbi:hypothetical protein [Pseudomonas sp. 02C 26]|uniref:hypothetical protein n=1 Tax=Pseudomonas sp. 02C 26 TaxID=2054914 RepID=UPI0012FF08F2|nr:hypothetical protein [Pseudomonas sp. 02C 26]